MTTIADACWQFVVEWYDPMPQLKKQYVLKYFVEQGFVEMIDVKNKKLFLKKSPCPKELCKEDFFVGAKVLIYSRELDIVDYGDSATRKALSMVVQLNICLLTPESYPLWGKILDTLLSRGYTMTKVRSVQFPQNTADRICNVFGLSKQRADSLSSGVTLVVSLQKENGVSALVDDIGDINRDFGCNLLVPESGIDISAIQEIAYDTKIPNSSTLDNCTCVIIKPHAVKSKHFGQILDHIINQGYDVSAIASLYFEKVQAEEFLEVYKGVIPDYNDHVSQFCVGMSIALEVRAEDAVSVFRSQTAGPWEINMAKELRPDSLRAKFGLDAVRNAVHCTDLPTDGVLECEYCFRILAP